MASLNQTTFTKSANQPPYITAPNPPLPSPKPQSNKSQFHHLPLFLSPLQSTQPAFNHKPIKKNRAPAKSSAKKEKENSKEETGK
jgi:hypothetical protein